MKDEEMAEKHAEEYIMREDVVTENDRVPFDNGYGFQTVSFEDEVKKGYKDGFLAGLKADRPQWHTPDARLPEEEGDYLFCLRDGEETMYDIVGVSIDGNGYVSLDSHIWSITDVIAWTELPTFDKE